MILGDNVDQTNAVERISEGELILPALWVLSEGDMGTFDLGNKLTQMLQPKGKDAEVVASNPDGSVTYFQKKVQNLVSHKTLEKRRYATFDRDETERGIVGGNFQITDTGKKYLRENEEQLKLLYNGKFSYEQKLEALGVFQNEKEKGRNVGFVPEEFLGEGALSYRSAPVAVRKRIDSLRKSARKLYTQSDGKIPCACCDFDYFKRNGFMGDVDMHHTKPIMWYEDQGEIIKASDIKNAMVPACWECHRYIHRFPGVVFTIEEVKLSRAIRKEALDITGIEPALEEMKGMLLVGRKQAENRARKAKRVQTQNQEIEVL
jgi:hypothetical protein